ncbi:MAG: glycosyl hydrolase family 17 protein, partial [Myxococcota bacterium]
EPPTHKCCGGLLGRRGFNPKGKPLIAGISYGPYRENQRPGGPNPTSAQIAEDLAIIASRWSMIRVYSSRGVTEDIVRTVRDNNLPLQVLVGAWIAADAPEDNAEEVAEAIRIANSYPEQVLGVSVGNETQVYWSGHRSPRDALIDHIRTVRAAVRQPVTTADDYNFWNTPESHAVADEVDFLLLHAYAMWNQQQLADAVSWTEATVDAIAAEHPDLTIVIGETGWATELNPEVGDQAKYIKAPAGEAEQARFYAEFTTWAQGRALPYFYFEAFDEPWKGGDDPRDVEKHWGLYRVDRTPKAAMIKGEGTP